ncbi:hypothetical protein KQI89_01100 [Clostridium sp. MSJ-4]|uniref:Uncharacterized protein n=1 Tax=Clostridium simiarum TaxID=2841506 RepID=A0ABS6EWA1_9CLOT|nr:hypothetical protein [Clostridium simiarum]MBU5590351.1 hypothetical protein [Clostridium simiarum]
MNKSKNLNILFFLESIVFLILNITLYKSIIPILSVIQSYIYIGFRSKLENKKYIDKIFIFTAVTIFLIVFIQDYARLH